MLCEADLRRITQQVVAASSPLAVYLFGSYAWGTAHKRSDVDLLVIVPPGSTAHAERGRIYGRLRSVAARIDIVVYTSGELQEALRSKFSFASTILPRARVLYETANGARVHS